MCAWAKHLGAQVLGVVSKPASVERAKAAGCDQVFVFDAQSLPSQVMQATQGRRWTWSTTPSEKTLSPSLDCLRPRGLMVSFGATSGLPPAVEVGVLNAKGSLFLTRPSLAAHTATIEEYQSRAQDVLDAIAAGILTPRIWKSYALKDAALAHADLEQGRSQGSIILTPESLQTPWTFDSQRTDELATLLALADQGSFAAAGRLLGVILRCSPSACRRSSEDWACAGGAHHAPAAFHHEGLRLVEKLRQAAI
jgi:hypothetical protein